MVNCFRLFLLLFSALLTWPAIYGQQNTNDSVYNDAVVYIHKGRSLPAYMFLAIELASRTNHVVVISEVSATMSKKSLWQNVSYIDLKHHKDEADNFSKLYVHLALDKSEERKQYELMCLQRWFILQSFMTRYQVKRVFHGDLDTAVFMNMETAFRARATCDAVISIEVQKDHRRRRASGHASLWTHRALTDFTQFTTAMYARHVNILQSDRTTGVSDMTLLWFWWVARTPRPGWRAGRPWDALSIWLKSASLPQLRQASDSAFDFSKTLLSSQARDLLPVYMPFRSSDLGNGRHAGGKLTICNGLDVVRRTVFDHMQGWSESEDFSLNLSADKMRPSGGDITWLGVPSIVGATLKRGGAPEDVITASTSSISNAQAPLVSSKYENVKLSFTCLHYQGDTKELMTYDICRLLTLTGPRKIINIHNRVLCGASLKRHPGLPCRLHPVIGQDYGGVCA